MISSNVLSSTYIVNVNRDETKPQAINGQSQLNSQHKYVTTTCLPYFKSNNTHAFKNTITKLVGHRVFNSSIITKSTSPTVYDTSSASIAGSSSSTLSENSIKRSQDRFIYTKLTTIGEKTGSHSSNDLNLNMSLSNELSSQSNYVIYSIRRSNEDLKGNLAKKFLSVSNMNFLSKRVVENELNPTPLSTKTNCRDPKRFEPTIYLNNFSEG